MFLSILDEGNSTSTQRSVEMNSSNHFRLTCKRSLCQELLEEQGLKLGEESGRGGVACQNLNHVNLRQSMLKISMVSRFRVSVVLLEYRGRQTSLDQPPTRS